MRTRVPSRRETSRSKMTGSGAAGAILSRISRFSSDVTGTSFPAGRRHWGGDAAPRDGGLPASDRFYGRPAWHRRCPSPGVRRETKEARMAESQHPKGALLFMLIYLVTLTGLWLNAYLRLWGVFP
jgi:hypothetical protein